MGIIERFKVTVADDNDITFKKVGELLSIFITIQKLENPRMARQTLVNTFANLTESDYQKCEEIILEVSKNEKTYRNDIDRLQGEKHQRLLNRSMGRMNKLINDLHKMNGAI